MGPVNRSERAIVMKYRITIDFEDVEAAPPTLWDIAHNASDFVALALHEIKPHAVTRFYLRRLDGPSIAAALEGGEEIDIRELLPS
jgi:hypothetical protein